MKLLNKSSLVEQAAQKNEHERVKAPVDPSTWPIAQFQDSGGFSWGDAPYQVYREAYHEQPAGGKTQFYSKATCQHQTGVGVLGMMCGRNKQPPTGAVNWIMAGQEDSEYEAMCAINQLNPNGGQKGVVPGMDLICAKDGKFPVSLSRGSDCTERNDLIGGGCSTFDAGPGAQYDGDEGLGAIKATYPGFGGGGRAKWICEVTPKTSIIWDTDRSAALSTSSGTSKSHCVRTLGDHPSVRRYLYRMEQSVTTNVDSEGELECVTTDAHITSVGCKPGGSNVVEGTWLKSATRGVCRVVSEPNKSPGGGENVQITMYLICLSKVPVDCGYARTNKELKCTGENKAHMPPETKCDGGPCTSASTSECCQTCPTHTTPSTDTLQCHNICRCNNGMPEVGDACAAPNAIDCKSCHRGYERILQHEEGSRYECHCSSSQGYELKNGNCVLRVCNSCQYGVAAQGTACPDDRYRSKCASCDKNFHINNDGQCLCRSSDGRALVDGNCVEKLCSGCQNGVAAKEKECPSQGGDACESCNEHFTHTGNKKCVCDKANFHYNSGEEKCQCRNSDGNVLVDETNCIKKSCSACEYGTGETGTGCVSHGGPDCKSCNKPFNLKNKRCVCDGTNFVFDSNAGTCTCPEPFIYDASATPATCTCPASFRYEPSDVNQPCACRDQDGRVLKSQHVCIDKVCSSCKYGKPALKTACPTHGGEDCAQPTDLSNPNDPNACFVDFDFNVETKRCECVKEGYHFYDPELGSSTTSFVVGENDTDTANSNRAGAAGAPSSSVRTPLGKTPGRGALEHLLEQEQREEEATCTCRDEDGNFLQDLDGKIECLEKVCYTCSGGMPARGKNCTIHGGSNCTEGTGLAHSKEEKLLASSTSSGASAVTKYVVLAGVFVFIFVLLESGEEAVEVVEEIQ
ncbi:unnamed protein product [Amoebophrya sp. A25]|nr:unnamed protein product [Amoebophrya sp. A25]|eukprot:GSA25T00006729001.1